MMNEILILLTVENSNYFVEFYKHFGIMLNLFLHFKVYKIRNIDILDDH